MEKKKELELYIHIPFCEKKCAYCDFLSFPRGKDVQKQYVDKLLSEIEQKSGDFRDAEVPSVFIGGGTPSILEPSQIRDIMGGLRESFCIRKDAEISMEANPGTVNGDKLEIYRQAGINRLSFGLQSADNRELKLLGRIHTWETFLLSYQKARECGFKNINVDLMSALPGQTVESWMETLHRTVELMPEHISAYSLILEEGTPFFERYGDGRGVGLLPDEDAEREMYHRTKEYLKRQGYKRYEISNYAREGRECRHNIGYWSNVPYLGLGLGASSYVDGRRFRNEDDLSAYLGGCPKTRFDEEILSIRDMEEEFFYVGLRLTSGVSQEEFENRFHIRAEEVYPGIMEKFVRDGAAVIENGRFRLTDYGMDVSNYVMAGFLFDGSEG